MSQRSALLLSLVLSSTVALAQPHAYNGAEVPADPLRARVHVLANGLTVMLSVNPAEPRVQTLIAVRAGSKNDPADNTGLAHYLEHMLFKGTDRLGAKNYAEERIQLDRIESLYEEYRGTDDESRRREIYRAIDSTSQLASKYVVANEYDRVLGSIGARGTNAWTWFDQTVYTNDVPSSQMERWLVIEGERFRNPMLRLFHTELEAVYEEKNISLDRDDDKQNDLALARLFPNHPYGTQTTLGTVEHLKNPSLKKIREFYDRYYVPNNMAVIIAGDIDPDATLRLIEQYFGSMVRSDLPISLYQENPKRNAPIEESVYGPDPESVMIAMAVPGASTREAMMLEIVDQLLNYKDAGLLDLELEKKQRVLEAWTSAWLFNDYSIATLGGRPLEGQTLEQVRDLLLEQLARIKRGDFDEAQLRSIMLNRRIDRTRSFETNEGRAYTMLDAFIQDMPWNDYLRRLEAPEHVTRQEIVDFANRHFTNDYVVVFKRIGEDTTVKKIAKPEITPVQLDRESSSDFARTTLAMPAQVSTPSFVDFSKQITATTLAPGIAIRHHANTENDLFSLDYVFEMGERNWKELPYAIDLLPFLGTSNLSAEQVSREFFRLGIDFDVNASEEEVRLSISGPGNSLHDGIELFESLLGDVQPDQKALDALVDRELKHRADAKLDKRTVLWSGLWNYAVYGKSNPFNSVVPEAQLKRLKADDLVRIIHQLRSYRHDILYYGAETPNRIEEMMRHHHAVPSAPADYPHEVAYRREEQKENVIYFVNEDMVQAEIVWLRKGDKFDASKWPTVEYFNEYFGGGMGAVVFQTIREARALAYSSFARYETPDRLADPSYSVAYLGTQADKIDEAIVAMRELITTVPRSESAFKSAREAIRNQIANDRTMRHEVLESYLEMRRLGLDHELRHDVWKGIDAVKLDDVVQFHSTQFGDRPFTMAVIGSRDRIDMKALARHGRVIELTDKQIFGY